MSDIRKNPTLIILAMRWALSIAIASCSAGICNATNIMIVRHAEKETRGADPDLTATGISRARELARISKILGVTRVYTTGTKRTRQTAAAVTDKLGLETATRYDNVTRRWANEVLAKHIDQTILIVGHSNTVPLIVRQFGGGDVSIRESDFDRLILLDVSDSATEFASLRYSVPESFSSNELNIQSLSSNQPELWEHFAHANRGAWINDKDISDDQTQFRRQEQDRMGHHASFDAARLKAIYSGLLPSIGRPSTHLHQETIAMLNDKDWAASNSVLANEPTYAKNVRMLLNNSILIDEAPAATQLKSYGVDFILGDSVANQDVNDTFESTVMIGSSVDTRICSGVLVAPNVVLTAKHCFDIRLDYVYTGVSLAKFERSALVDIKDRILHPKYDLAVVQLSKDVDATPASLAEEGTLNQHNAVTIAGYGFSSQTSRRQDDEIKFLGEGEGIRRRVTVAIRSYLEDEDEARKFRAEMGKEFIASGTIGGAACFGDSGGPALIQKSNEWQVIGITSGSLPKELWVSSERPCGNGSKTVRTDDREIRDWIIKNTDAFRK